MAKLPILTRIKIYLQFLGEFLSLAFFYPYTGSWLGLVFIAIFFIVVFASYFLGITFTFISIAIMVATAWFITGSILSAVMIRGIIRNKNRKPGTKEIVREVLAAAQEARNRASYENRL